MTAKLEETAAAVGRNKDVAEKLDQILTGPNDRAFVVCELKDCKSNVKGRCTIYAVQDVLPMKMNGPCENFQGAERN